MRIKPFHTSFKIDDLCFGDVTSLLKWVSKISESSYEFLKNWFNNDDFVIVQTSGSTGKPKKIRLKKEHMKNSATATGEFFNLQESTTALVCLSADYIAGKMMLVRAMELGWNIDIVDAVSNPLSKNTKNYDFSAMVPMQLEKSKSELHRIKKLIVGGGVVSNSLVHEIQAVSTKIFATYGMTETITHVAVKPLNHSSNQNFYTVLPNVDVFVDNRSCLVINAPKVSDELVITNDVVQLISENQFEWLGRFDNVINSGGVKLQPEKIEAELSKIINSRFFVAGLPDKVLGEKLVLIVEGVKREINYNTIDLTKYETPKDIYFIKTFVETETRKIKRGQTLSSLGLN